MLKHNVDNLDLRKPEEYFYRPIGPEMKKMPMYVRDLVSILADFYFVEHILCYGGNGRYYEIFGNRENLDIAEYIFCCLLRQSERLWLEYSAELKKKYGGTRGIASKNHFIEGLVAGYREKLEEQRNKREGCVQVNNALIWTGDKLMQEMFRQAYPGMRHSSNYRHACGGGYHAGFNKGKGISLSVGLHSGGNKGNCGKLIHA